MVDEARRTRFGKQVSLRLSDALSRRLDALARETERNAADILRHALSEYLAKHGKP